MTPSITGHVTNTLIVPGGSVFMSHDGQIKATSTILGDFSLPGMMADPTKAKKGNN